MRLFLACLVVLGCASSARADVLKDNVNVAAETAVDFATRLQAMYDACNIPKDVLSPLRILLDSMKLNGLGVFDPNMVDRYVSNALIVQKGPISLCQREFIKPSASLLRVQLDFLQKEWSELKARGY